jgi:hypothetical protein
MTTKKERKKEKIVLKANKTKTKSVVLLCWVGRWLPSPRQFVVF